MTPSAVFAVPVVLEASAAKAVAGVGRAGGVGAKRALAPGGRVTASGTVLVCSAEAPLAVLKLPVVLLVSAYAPLAVLTVPVVLSPGAHYRPWPCCCSRWC